MVFARIRALAPSPTEVITTAGAIRMIGLIMVTEGGDSAIERLMALDFAGFFNVLNETSIELFESESKQQQFIGVIKQVGVATIMIQAITWLVSEIRGAGK
jgi:hypothetical protein